MKSTLELSAIGVPFRADHVGQAQGAPAWEYCFLLQDESIPFSSDLTQLTAAGWIVVSFRTRYDSQREYLLKRPSK